MMTQQIQQRMMKKLAMIQLVEARMAMPLRGTIAMAMTPMSYSSIRAPATRSYESNN